MRRSTRTRRSRRRGGVLTGLIVAALMLGGGVVGARWFVSRYQVVLPLADQCAALVTGQRVSLTPEQARYAAIIVAEAQRRELAPRASSIALATAYQESGIRNLDHGDLDSVGLFQQRPSQDWGSVEQIMDPWYASGKFYEALVKIPGWRNADLNDIAQKIQISAHPEAYRKHVPNARRLASALTGETPASFGCSLSGAGRAEPEQVTELLSRAFGDRVELTGEARTLRVKASSPEVAWSAAHLAIAAGAGVSSAQLGGASWNRSAVTWQGRPGDATVAVLTFG
ncbi:MAG: hypothetical protein Q3997_02780 [Propionibacteriaceae bacterium]|nr:hypothetical protein [Propionibacteriaceae bacterium]